MEGNIPKHPLSMEKRRHIFLFYKPLQGLAQPHGIREQCSVDDCIGWIAAVAIEPNPQEKGSSGSDLINAQQSMPLVAFDASLRGHESIAHLTAGLSKICDAFFKTDWSTFSHSNEESDSESSVDWSGLSLSSEYYSPSESSDSSESSSDQPIKRAKI